MLYCGTTSTLSSQKKATPSYQYLSQMFLDFHWPSTRLSWVRYGKQSEAASDKQGPATTLTAYIVSKAARPCQIPCTIRSPQDLGGNLPPLPSYLSHRLHSFFGMHGKPLSKPPLFPLKWQSVARRAWNFSCCSLECEYDAHFLSIFSQCTCSVVSNSSHILPRPEAGGSELSSDPITTAPMVSYGPSYWACSSQRCNMEPAPASLS